jgi:hypothetical protein
MIRKLVDRGLPLWRLSLAAVQAEERYTISADVTVPVSDQQVSRLRSADDRDTG